ncbi:MAG: V-type ATP synthase subunit I [Candidatus Hydrogenedentes bacterium]|nr:V-type ATP synthase subunit I [Candidatus Hydrogenedentota bacterium]
MAIDKMKKVTFLTPAKASQRLLKSLHSLGVCEITDVLSHYPEFKEVFKRPEVVTEECDANLQKVQTILNLLDVLSPVVKGFIQGLAPVPLLITKEELDYALHKFDLENVYKEAQELDIEYRKLERAISNIENQIAELSSLEELPFRIDFFRKPKKIKLIFGKILYGNYELLVRDEVVVKKCAVELIYPGRYYRKDADKLEKPNYNPKDFVFVLVACLPNDLVDIQNRLKGYAFEEVSLPNINGTVRDHIRELKADLSTLKVQVQEIASKAQKLSIHRRVVEVLKAFWENRKKMVLARCLAVEGKWVQILSGYVRERDLTKLQETLRKEMPEVSIFVEDPQPGEDVPVSITLPPLVKPVQLLINMYGLPPYDFFDPSPYLMWGFYLFFGICFGDVAYGVILLLASLYLMRRTKPYEGVYNFSKLLYYASIPTIVCGFLFGSFFGDLYKPEYLGENNIFQKIMESTTILNPVDQPVYLLLFALFVGVLNQFYGIGLKMYGMIKRGDSAGAIMDGLLWLILLPGFIILVSGMFVTPPGWLTGIGWILFGVGAIGLILTQGRDQNNPIARLISGVISLYGIVGSYGITSFIGDTMSYCRLLALGLTTSIVAMSFNMIANLLKSIPYVGLIVFVLVLIVGHLFNFLISVMGAFVHSMRLILVEFFGRFYEGGGKPFEPLGFNSDTAILVNGENKK